MVRTSSQRSGRYQAKIDGSVIGARADAYPQQKTNFKNSVGRQVEIETIVKAFIAENGISVLETNYYMLFGKKLANLDYEERNIQYNKWIARGLNPFLLAKLAFILYNVCLEIRVPFINAHCLHYFSFYDADKPTIQDLIKGSAPATNTGATKSASNQGSCIHLLGDNKGVNTSINLLSFPDEFTLVFWVLGLTYPAGAHNIIDGGWTNTNGLAGIGFHSNNNFFKFGIGSSALDKTTSTGLLSEYYLHMHAISKKGNKIEFCYNKTIQPGTYTITGNFKRDYLLNFGNSSIPILVDEVSLWDKAFTQQEFIDMYNNGATPRPKYY